MAGNIIKSRTSRILTKGTLTAGAREFPISAYRSGAPRSVTGGAIKTVVSNDIGRRLRAPEARCGMNFFRVPSYDSRWLIGELAFQARSNGIFAISEISKGLAIVTIGDMVIADEVGELVIVMALSATAAPSGWRFQLRR